MCRVLMATGLFERAATLDACGGDSEDTVPPMNDEMSGVFAAKTL